ncbi:recombinase family protein [Streptomyces sp. NPDC049954]|uniref:recombinase family protein n=1 Tax=Streptomyces sp. NPDC049954 TaxID=3155779 RepID=UPI0034316D7D
MNPVIFGYMRVPDDLSDEAARRTQEVMKAYAEAHGLHLMTVFHEYVSGGQAAFTDLVEAVGLAGVRQVLVPSYRELALNRSLQDAMALHLSSATGARILAVEED